MNLAVDDGFATTGRRAAAPLRSPHNSHMNILARTGATGLGPWSCLLASWFATVMSCARQAWRKGDGAWGNLLLFIVCYWMASVVNSSFDVALEGPMMGVWFWTLVGFGLGVAAIYRAGAKLASDARANWWQQVSRHQQRRAGTCNVARSRWAGRCPAGGKSLAEATGPSGCAGVKLHRQEALCLECKGLGDEAGGAVCEGPLRGTG